MKKPPKTPPKPPAAPSASSLQKHTPMSGLGGLVARAYVNKGPVAFGLAVLLASAAVVGHLALSRISPEPAEVTAVETAKAKAAVPVPVKIETVEILPESRDAAEAERPAAEPADLEKPVAEIKAIESPVKPHEAVKPTAELHVHLPEPTAVAKPAVAEAQEDQPTAIIPEKMEDLDLKRLTAAVEELGLRTEDIERQVSAIEPETTPEPLKEPQAAVEPLMTADEAESVLSKSASDLTPGKYKLTPEDEKTRTALLAFLADAEKAKDADKTETAERQIAMFDATLDTEIEFRIVDGDKRKSGFWRSLKADAKQKQYFLLVEAVVDDEVVNWAIKDADTGRIASGAAFGLAVGEELFDRVADDKKADGKIDSRLVGLKPKGRIAPVWSIKTDGHTVEAPVK